MQIAVTMVKQLQDEHFQQDVDHVTFIDHLSVIIENTR